MRSHSWFSEGRKSRKVYRSMNIRNIFFSFIFLALIAVAAVAQTKSFAIQSAASYVTYDEPAGTFPLGGNAVASLYPINSNFDTINGQAYNCDAAAPAFQGRCGGVRVF